MKLPFVSQRQERWNRLDQLLQKITDHQMTGLTKAEIKEFSVLYLRLTSDLAMAKAQKLPAELIAFLNDLASRAYHQIYQPKQTRFHQFKQFIKELPFLIRQNRMIILFSAGIMVLGWLFGFLGQLVAPETVGHLIPNGIAKKILTDYQNNTWFNDPLVARPYISAQIMLNNIYVSIGAMAGGMLLGTYTLYILFINSFFLGVLSGAFFENGYGLSFWAMILPHGVIELTAIILSAAAGFLLARALLFPGELTRTDALKKYGNHGVKLFAGAVFFLVIAGLIEGYLSTINRFKISETIRLLFALITAVMLIGYLYLGKDKFEKDR